MIDVTSAAADAIRAALKQHDAKPFVRIYAAGMG
jgi:hypothetical protein